MHFTGQRGFPLSPHLLRPLAYTHITVAQSILGIPQRSAYGMAAAFQREKQYIFLNLHCAPSLIFL